MTYIEFQVEEPSMEALLNNLLPRIVRVNTTWRIINYRNKQKLLKKLPERLRGYKKRLEHEEILIFVLVDQDNCDCHELKNLVEDLGLSAGLASKAHPNEDGSYDLVSRIVVRELEAWYFGDIRALREVYPKLPGNLGAKAAYRRPDHIPDTWETLRWELSKAGYPGFSKIALAREMGARLDPATNVSRSFAAFRTALQLVL